MRTKIICERLSLSLPTQEDILPLYLELNLTEDISRNTLSIPFPFSLSGATAWIEQAHLSIKEKSAWVFTIRLRDNDEFIGVIGIYPNLENPTTAEVGYWIGNKYRGAGYTTEALKGITNFAFENLHMHCLFADCLVENIASLRVLEKAGYTLEKSSLQDIEKKNTKHDIHRLSIINIHRQGD